jgi:biopolymer transport protein ExbD
MPLKTQLDEQPSLNLTSMIDIVFNLMIFFMVGTRFSSLEERIDVRVPQVSSAAPSRAVPAKLTIAVQREGAILLDGQPVTLEQLGPRLRAERLRNPAIAVVVRGDGDGALKHAAGVLSACRAAGIADLGIAVRVEPGGQVESVRSAAAPERGAFGESLSR